MATTEKELDIIDRMRSAEGYNSVYEYELKDEAVDADTKPYQRLAWAGTVILIIAAMMASFVPEVKMFFGLPGNLHHYAFTVANGIWVAVGFLWKEKSLLVLNLGLTIIYIVGLLELV